jgi:serine/threonine protein kinase
MQLKTYHHDNVLSLKYILLVKKGDEQWANASKPEMYLAFEYLPHDLSGIIAEPTLVLKEPMIKAYMQQLLRAVAHIHSHGAMHCDIKS